MGLSQITNLILKTGKSFKVHSTLSKVDDFACVYVKETKTAAQKALAAETDALLGDASVWLEAQAQSKLPMAQFEVECFFKNLNSVQGTCHRPKSALSIKTKLERGLKKADTKRFDSFDEAERLIADGIGSRVFIKPLEKLSKAEIDTMIANTIYEGKKLTPDQVKLLRKYLDSPIPSKESEKAFKLYEAFAQPLIEKRSKEVVDRMTAGILKFRQQNEGLDIDDLRRRGLFDDDLLDMLKDKSIDPIQITRISNYRGAQGLPEFSNRQMQQISRAMNYNRTGGQLEVATDVRGLDDFLYPAENIKEYSDKAIKASGYRTAQANIIHQNGGRGEIQFRGPITNDFAEFEHIAYDLRQGKNTLGPLFDDYAKTIKKLTPKEYDAYNKYLEDCYNYYNRLELGLPAVKPKLPGRFPKILSEENMKALHDQSAYVEKLENAHFARHFERTA